MFPALRTVTWEVMNVLGVTAVMAYMGLVAMGYASEGPRYQLKFDFRHPVYSAQRLMVGMGVHFAALLVSIGKILLSPLFEASAEVGEWIAEHCDSETQERLRSRFM